MFLFYQLRIENVQYAIKIRLFYTLEIKNNISKEKNCGFVNSSVILLKLLTTIVKKYLLILSLSS
ncbi:hypothetical protein GVAMD_0990 [Gardnerella vaginalis AMD]|nr:hypothetical protein GVAMD_0990 [Gardnerella vaginalis AMD]